jgi:crotonobetainyl-CoA:carnitine CoA-transferase CaiB-like acyl-CoA transferase
MAEARDRPLAGITVLDFATLLPGPYATQVLADLGADVIKVESPRGDEARRVAAGVHDVVNRNKRSVVADLKTDDGRNLCLELARESDVVVEGFRPGVAARLGIGYANIRDVRPDIVYCSVSGYGQTGPLRDRPGHDINFLAASGALSFSAHWGEPPRRSGVPIGDLAGATFAVISILVALRERDRMGRGCHLDVAITDAAMAFISPRSGPSFMISNKDATTVSPTNDLYMAGDGVVLAVAAVEEKFWERLRAVMVELAPKLADRRFDDAAGRRRHGTELQTLLAQAFRQRTADHWIAVMRETDVPLEPVLTLAEAARSDHATSRGIVAEVDGQRQVVFPVLRDGEVLGQFRAPAPALGAHTDEVRGGARRAPATESNDGHEEGG